jgi:hypothetical protein
MPQGGLAELVGIQDHFAILGRPVRAKLRGLSDAALNAHNIDRWVVDSSTLEALFR